MGRPLICCVRSTPTPSQPGSSLTQASRRAKMSDNRDFDMRKIPGIEEMLASGVPESMDLSSRLEELEQKEDFAAAFIQRLIRERDEARVNAALLRQEIARLEALNGTGR